MQLVDVAHSLPHTALTELDQLRANYGWSDRNHRIFTRMFGLKSAAMHPDLPLRRMLALSANELAARNPELVGNVDYVFYCHAVNTTLPCDKDFLGQVVRDAFDSDAEIMSIANASCASAIMVIRMLEHMQLEREANVVILTGEKCFFEILQYAENQGVYGEATSAAFVKVGAETGTQIVATAAGHFDGLFAPMIDAGKEAAQAFDAAFMPKMTGLVTELLDRAKMTPEEINLIFPTHLSPFTSDRVAAQIGMTNAEIFKANLPHIGHCYCSDLFINYQTWLNDQSVDAVPNNILSFASGMTGSCAGIVLRRN